MKRLLYLILFFKSIIGYCQTQKPNWIIPPIIEGTDHIEFRAYSKNLIITSKDNKKGVKTINNEQILENKYETILISKDENYIKTYNKNNKGKNKVEIYDASGKKLLIDYKDIDFDNCDYSYPSNKFAADQIKNRFKLSYSEKDCMFHFLNDKDTIIKNSKYPMYINIIDDKHIGYYDDKADEVIIIELNGKECFRSKINSEARISKLKGIKIRKNKLGNFIIHPKIITTQNAIVLNPKFEIINHNANLELFETSNIYKTHEPYIGQFLLDSQFNKLHKEPFKSITELQDFNLIVLRNKDYFLVYDMNSNLFKKHNLEKELFLSSNGKSIVSKNNKKGIFDFETQKLIVPLEYNHLAGLGKNKYFYSQMENEFIIFNNKGNRIFQDSGYVETLHGECHLIYRSNKKINKVYNLIKSKKVFEHSRKIWSLHNLIQFEKNDHLHLGIIKDDQVIIINQNLKKGIPINSFEKKGLKRLFYFLNSKNKIGAYDDKGKLILPFEFDDVADNKIYYSYIGLKKDGKWGILLRPRNN